MYSPHNNKREGFFCSGTSNRSSSSNSSNNMPLGLCYQFIWLVHHLPYPICVFFFFACLVFHRAPDNISSHWHSVEAVSEVLLCKNPGRQHREAWQGLFPGGPGCSVKKLCGHRPESWWASRQDMTWPVIGKESSGSRGKPQTQDNQCGPAARLWGSKLN